MTNGKHEAKETLKSYSPTTTGLFPMKIIIETPKYSFWKYNKTEKGYEKVFFSPLPTIFNYGFVEGTKSADGMEEDVIVIGPRLPKGSTLERETFDGVVKFLDNSMRDDKRIIYISGFRSSVLLAYYFRLYALFKVFLYIFREGKLTKCRFEGIEFKEFN
ncbi:MAG: inorganic diphosphatase [Methanosarcina flavescens]|nr:inorganic diphosphatase [Methanosarcina flavescens]